VVQPQLNGLLVIQSELSLLLFTQRKQKVLPGSGCCQFFLVLVRLHYSLTFSLADKHSRLWLPLNPQRALKQRPPHLRRPDPSCPTSTSTNLGAFIDTKLPNGINLRIPSNGVENKLLSFISDPSKVVDRTTWFSFDRLEFDTDSATLKPSSREQLQNIAAILQAYPQVSLKIGGYTDNSGDAAHNLKLSGDVGECDCEPDSPVKLNVIRTRVYTLPFSLSLSLHKLAVTDLWHMSQATIGFCNRLSSVSSAR
jgi:hypothetical protein